MASPARINTTLLSRVTPSAQVLLQRTGNEAVLLDAASEHYFGLDEVGTRFWELVARDPLLQHAHAAMLAEYDVTPEQLEHDLLQLVDKLSDAGLVTVG